MTSTHAVAVVKRAFRCKKAGHAGTLDPLASGCLPIALGEATKTVPYVMDGRKAYRFTVTWGSETTTDDTEGPVTKTSEKRPARAEVEALLPRFTGVVMQVPPQFSAIKVDGERAYDIAREGEEVVLEAREVLIDRLEIVAHDGATTVLEADCGKGTYVRAIARDLGRALACYGHVTALRRTRVGPFEEADFVTAGDLSMEIEDQAEREAHLADLLAPVDRGLSELPDLNVSRHDAARLKRGQGVILRGRDAPTILGQVAVHCGHELIAIAEMDKGELKPHRVFNLA
jgi:tRNA pseudouridine55 synthase